MIVGELIGELHELLANGAIHLDTLVVVDAYEYGLTEHLTVQACDVAKYRGTGWEGEFHEPESSASSGIEVVRVLAVRRR